ncbi:MAG: hypothetical protein LQ342_002922 [Letrouitia transgressa]|nr:MAG: hypothetical protein LQ342_002922 [Letrouitia transgressa]
MASSTVNRPTNVQQKEADVNQKLQLYGIYSGIVLSLFTSTRYEGGRGNLPNKQIDVALNSAIASKALSKPSTKLSSEGQGLVGDLRDVIEQAKILLLTKNEGNLLQDFLWQTRSVTSGDAKLPDAPVDKATAQQHGNQALDGLRTLGTLLLSNGQFRKLLNDATILLRDVAGDAAQNAANRLNPSEEQLSQIDQPADDNTWHDVPDLSRDNLMNQAKSAYNKQKPFGKGEVKDAAGNATQAANPSGSSDPVDTAALAAQEQQTGTDQGVNAAGGAQQGLSQLRDQASANVPEETKSRAKEFRERTKSYASSKLPKERREQSIYRLKKMIVEIQGHQDYQQAIETLLTLAEQYGGHGRNLGQQGAGSVKGAHSNTALTTAETDLRKLLERFANYTSADDLIDSINNIYRDADADPELRKWFRSINTYVRKCLKEQGFIMQDAANEEWNQLYDQGNFLLRERYRDHTNRILDEVKFLGNQFDEDPLNRQFAQSLQKLFAKLGNDENGQPVFKKHLVTDLSQVIVPGIFESVRYVPVPRIEYSDPMVDAIIENLVIESDNLTPNSFEFGSDNYFRWGRKNIKNKNKNKVMVSISGVQMDLRDVSFFINKKQGFPSIKDTGIMDIFMGGTGLSFKIAMETADKSDRQHFFKINKVDVDMKSLTIKMKQSKHKLLFNFFKPLLFRVVKPALTKVLEKLIKDQAHQLDAKAYEIHQEAERVAKVAKQNPEKAPNIYNRYVQAAQKTLTKNKEKAQAVASDKKTNVAMTQNDSIFQNIKLPGGISTKATEYKNLAAKGEKWESPVFVIGSAPESTGITKPPAVTRKPHNVSSGGVRGPQTTNPNTSSGIDGIGQTNGTAGFSNQVNQAFSSGGDDDYSLKNTGAVNGKVAESGNTTLGANNPVLTGST